MTPPSPRIKRWYPHSRAVSPGPRAWRPRGRRSGREFLWPSPCPTATVSSALSRRGHRGAPCGVPRTPGPVCPRCGPSRQRPPGRHVLVPTPLLGGSLPLLSPAWGALAGPRACSCPLWLLSPDPALTRNLSHAGTRHWSSLRPHGRPSSPPQTPPRPPTRTAQGTNLSRPCPECQLQTLALPGVLQAGTAQARPALQVSSTGRPPPRGFRKPTLPSPSSLSLPFLAPAMADGRWPASEHLSHSRCLLSTPKPPPAVSHRVNGHRLRPVPEVKTLATPTLPSSPSASPIWSPGSHLVQPPASALPPVVCPQHCSGGPWRTPVGPCPSSLREP